MKKLFLFALLVTLTSTIYAASGDLFSTGPNEEFRIMSDGTIFSTAGVVNVEDFWLDVPSISSVCIYGEPTSAGMKISTQAIWANGGSGNWTRGTTTYTVRDIVQPVYPMSITGCIVSTTTDGGASAYTAVTASATMIVYGTNAKGETINETIKISTGTPGQTLQAFATVSSFTVTVSSINGIPLSPLVEPLLSVKMGVGKIFGLKNNIEKKSDIYDVFEGTGNVNVNNTTVNTAYDTYIPNNAPNGTRDYFVWYRTKRMK